MIACGGGREGAFRRALQRLISLGNDKLSIEADTGNAERCVRVRECENIKQNHQFARRSNEIETQHSQSAFRLAFLCIACCLEHW